MSISGALNNAITGLGANSRMAEVVSSNLSNALTPGYARREVDLSSTGVGGRGGGVRVDAIRRVVDQGVLSDRRAADADLAQASTARDGAAGIEALIGSVGDADGLSGRLSAFEQALMSSSSDPSSEPRLQSVLDRAAALASGFAQASTGIQAQRQDADRAIRDGVAQLNTSLTQVQTLNADIARAVRNGQDAAALMDARQRVVDTIATLVPVRQQDRGDGQIALYSTSGATLIDGSAAQFGFNWTPTITAPMTLAGGGLSGITLNGDPLPGGRGLGRLTGGLLEAQFIQRDTALVAAQEAVDLAAADLVARFSDPRADPTLTPGAPGLLTDGGAAMNPADITGLAGRLEINALADPAQGGDLWRLRDGLGAAAPGTVGNAGQINALRDALRLPIVPVVGASSETAFQRLQNLTAGAGDARLRADEALAFASARQSTLQQVEAAMGVDSDIELQKLIQIEQAYAANAKLIQTVSDMIQRIMDL